MKSIKSKLLLSLGVLMGVMCLGLAIVSFINSNKALTSNLGKTLPKIAQQSASNIQGRLEGQLNALEVIAARNDIKDLKISMEKKMPVFSEEVKRSGNIKMGIADKNGDIKYTDGTSTNVKDREYFQKALSGENNISDPLKSKANGQIVVVYAVPIINNNQVDGVLVSTGDSNKLSELTNQVKFGETGNAFMITKDGTTIAHSNKDLVLKMYNAIEEAKKDDSLLALADIEKLMAQGKTGIDKYKFDGIEKYVGYAPVSGTQWSVAVVVSSSEILSEMDSLTISIIISSIIFILIGFVVVYIIASNISKGLKSTSKHLDLLAKGDLTQEVSPKYLKLKDEVGDMTKSMQTMQESLREMINTIKENSSNVNVQSGNLSSVADEISSASENVALAINEIAQGTGSQAEDLINVTDILNEFSNKLSRMVSEIQIVDSTSREISLRANESSGDMNKLNDSVAKVGHSFKNFNGKIIGLGKDINKINDITNIINSIAEQTNLLALNAAIEAARAGESGRGFSVVADEIRKLAEQSKVSSENISKLISVISKDTDVIVQDSLSMDDELINQVDIINNSIISFTKIIESVNEVIPKIETVKNSAQDIDQDKNSILTRVEEVSSVALEVSASSEEISASSEEMNAATDEVVTAAKILSAMTSGMLDEVNKFKI
ncbi:methyl-accepting chemotaxis protein [Clostridium lacusfryxellense]|uniref:methyl-accepting chemotaxis protein n=1 Tax=Clostridium lacusfryxellense TaxID=205328 RepID=UPI001C0BDAB6|nr:methyl-accepting chemotaxis protein [Clostridium lacusfryxellense]MBU3111662.1 methyl-accepting chemotaxis protein [Clostridium lacusfryxellense]